MNDSATPIQPDQAPPSSHPITPPPPHPITPPPPARPFPWFPYALLALLAASVVTTGLALLYWLPNTPDLGIVNQVRLTAKPGIDLAKLEDVLDTPDYYLEILTEGGDPGVIRTTTQQDTPVGNGLDFKFPVPLRLADIKEIKVWDENVRKDSLVDRIDHPGGSRNLTGERFNFALQGYTPPPPNDRRIGWALVISGGVVFLLAIVRFVHAQVI